MKCPECNNYNSEGTFCAHCGSSLPTDFKECGLCHKMNPTNATFCNNCGRSLTKNSKISAILIPIEKIGRTMIIVVLLFLTTSFIYHAYSYFNYDVIPLTCNIVDYQGNITETNTLYAWLIKDPQGLYREVSKTADETSKAEAIEAYKRKERPACLIFGLLTIFFSITIGRSKLRKS